MKVKITILFVILSALPLFCDAEEMSYAAKSFRSNIQSFLREEGFGPTIDNDGSLCFKKEGEAYWIDISGEKPFYVSFHKAGLNAKNESEEAILKALNEVNTTIRAIKCCYYNDLVSFSIESYCYVAEDFKYVFYEYLKILEFSESEVKEAYSKYNTSTSYNSSKAQNRSNSTIGSVSSRSGNVIYINSPILETQYHKWWATSIELGTYNTKVSKVVSPQISNTYVCATKDEYIEDCDTGKRYYIQSSDIGIEPNRTTLYEKKSRSFTDIFPALPKTVKRINIWSGDDYYVKNLQIR